MQNMRSSVLFHCFVNRGAVVQTVKLILGFNEQPLNISHAPDMQVIAMQVTTIRTRACSLLKSTQKKANVFLYCRTLTVC